MKKYCLVVLMVVAQVAVGRTIIVAADGSEEFIYIAQAVDSAVAGDTVLVRDGYYPGLGYDGEEFTVDSGVVVTAEHSGGAYVVTSPYGLTLSGAAHLMGFELQSFPLAHTGLIVWIIGGPATLYNCRFHCGEPNSFGDQLRIACNGQPPLIRACSFQIAGPYFMVNNTDSTNVWMPNNYYGITDTTYIHHRIWDGIRLPGYGFVYVSPVLDSFEWLAAEDPPSAVVVNPSISVYPNPSQGTFNLILPGKQYPEQVAIYNLLGQRIWSRNNNTPVSTQILNPDGLPNGSYFLHVSTRDQAYTTRITIIH
ncbi:MAG: T9SS type A sorting domain-containing protein [Calditrichota bacterium]